MSLLACSKTFEPERSEAASEEAEMLIVPDWFSVKLIEVLSEDVNK